MLNKLYVSHRETISAIAEDHRLPMFGPLDIDNYKRFLEEAREFYKSWSVIPFPYTLQLENFEPLYDLGAGAFGRVILVKYKLFEKSYYAMKIVSKKSVVEANIVEFALHEKRVLQGFNFPFCLRLEYYTSDYANLYYLLPFITGGELYGLIQKNGKLGENLSKFYVGQIVLALEFMHYCGVIHRDLKPENILIDHLGYLKIADYGFAKEVKTGGRTYTFCGTPDYIAPEIILGHPYSFAVDWWSMGVMIYEMVKGTTPFHKEDTDTMHIYNKIVDGKYNMPPKFSSDLKDLISRLLVSDATKRLGNLKGGVEEIKQHVWLKEISWLDLFNRRINPPYVPKSIGDFDTANFPRLKKLPSSFVIVPGDISKNAEYDKLFEAF